MGRENLRRLHRAGHDPFCTRHPAVLGSYGVGMVPLTPKRERWAEALAIAHRYGERGPVVIAERVGALALQGDFVGVNRWKEIAVCYDELVKAQASPQ